MAEGIRVEIINMSADAISSDYAPLEAAEPIAKDAVSKGSTKTAVRWGRGVFAVGGVAALVAIAAAMLGGVSPAPSATHLTHTIARNDLQVIVTEEGTLESSNNKEFKCKVKGGSTVIWVIENGTQVKPGDVLVRLDTSAIEDKINAQKITYQNALATFAKSESDAAVAQIAVTEYLEGTFRKEMQTAQSNVAIGEENLRVAQNVLDHSEKMFRKGYISKLELDGNVYSVEHARLQLDLYQTEVDVLERFTKPKKLEELNSALKTATAKLASDKAALDLEKARLDREQQQLENCVLTSDVAGMVIYPEVEEWRELPEIEEGAAVREDQVLLMIPDLTNMQVKVGIHESKVDRLKVGMPARVKLQDGTVDGELLSIASVTRPTGWWNGNMVKYDTVIRLDSPGGVKPGMSAAVEILLGRHESVLTIPVAAVVEHEADFFCWVESGTGTERHTLELGDTNDQFIVVKSGLTEGDRVVLNPRSSIVEAQREALRPYGERKPPALNADRQAIADSKQSTDSETTGDKLDAPAKEENASNTHANADADEKPSV
jgi:multidrug efflux pump subunit AcrA (membrane-fusion protein)